MAWDVQLPKATTVLHVVLSHYKMLWWHSRQKHQTLRAPIFMQPEAVKNSSLVYSHHSIDASYHFFF